MKYLQDNKDNSSILSCNLYFYVCNRLISSVDNQINTSTYTKKLIPWYYVKMPSSSKIVNCLLDGFRLL